jgi:hypothetical protein
MFISKINVPFFAQSSHPDDYIMLLLRHEESKQKQTRGKVRMDPRADKKPVEEEEEWLDDEWDDEEYEDDSYPEYEEDDYN